MSENKKYYYMKLKENFFTSERMVVLEMMPDGILYSNLLLKMYLMSLKHNGILLLHENLPHTPQTIATFTRHQIGTVERALQIFLKLGSDRADFLANLNAYDLLILDDLGAERGTEYALEQVFAVIDARYRSRKPLIVTTNLTLDALKHPDDLAHARIYDRILEICAPILFGGENLRVEKANETKTAARNLLLPDNAA